MLRGPAGAPDLAERLTGSLDRARALAGGLSGLPIDRAVEGGPARADLEALAAELTDLHRLWEGPVGDALGLRGRLQQHGRGLSPMTVTRRSVLTATVAVGAAVGPMAGAAGAADPGAADVGGDAGEGGPALWLSAGQSADGTDRIAGFGTDGAIAFAEPLPARGHAPAVRPGGRQAVICARRPGTLSRRSSTLPSGRIVHRIDAAEGRHFYGQRRLLPRWPAVLRDRERPGLRGRQDWPL